FTDGAGLVPGRMVTAKVVGTLGVDLVAEASRGPRSGTGVTPLRRARTAPAAPPRPPWPRPP
ncbi:hypothetical protein ACWEPM_10900, partial [Streptomyces sp. NPDC004244]